MGTFGPTGVARRRLPWFVEFVGTGTITTEGTVAGSIGRGSRAELLGRATGELADIAMTIDRLYDCSSHSIELIEATRAIHVALNAVGALSASLGNPHPASARVEEVTPVGEDVSPRTGPTSSAAPAPCSTPISILYDDLLEPIGARSDGEKTPPTSTVVT